MYCATHIAIDQARLEQIVDIFQTVKSVRMQRPGSVPTEVLLIDAFNYAICIAAIFFYRTTM